MKKPANLDAFFWFVRERYHIRLKRNAGVRKPWTQNEVLQNYSFTEVFREDDKTTRWLRAHVRDPLRGDAVVLPAVLIFRWFNRIETGQAIFDTFDGYNSEITPFRSFMKSGETRDLKVAIRKYRGTGPYVTGAYTINTKCAGGGLNKLDGVLRLIEMWFDTHDWRKPETGSLEAFCIWCKSPCLSEFMTDQISIDLRWTHLLENAPDIMTWANPGPGCAQGLNQVFERERKAPKAQMIEEMRQLLDYSQKNKYWPHTWPKFELHEIENCLCEFNKFCRGYSRRRYNGSC